MIFETLALVAVPLTLLALGWLALPWSVETTPDARVYRCAECGSSKVQHAHWVELNTETVLEPFGSWCGSLGNSWCAECEAHGRITYPGEIDT